MNAEVLYSRAADAIARQRPAETTEILGVVSSIQAVLGYIKRTSSSVVGYLVPGENKYRNPALQVGGVSKIETIHMLMSPVGFRSEKGCAGDARKN
jgi:hypothetical protein